MRALEIKKKPIPTVGNPEIPQKQNKTKQKIIDLESIYNWCILLHINYLGPFLGGSSASGCLARGHLGQFNF